MRIAFVSSLTGGSWAGSEELWGGAAMRLLKDSHQVAACVKYWPRTADRVLELKQCGAEVFSWRTQHDHLFYKVWSGIDPRERDDFRRLRRFKPDLAVISQGSHTDGLPWMLFCRDAGIPYAVIVQCNAEIWWVGDGAAARLAEGYLGACGVFCVSRHNLELLEWQIGNPLPKACVVWNPWKAPPATLPPWPGGGTLRLACLARLNPTDKGHDLLMRAMALRQWRERPVELNLFGDLAPYEEILRRMIARLDLKNVHIRGYLDDPNPVWQTHHIFIMPSRVEGLPIALVEAMWNARATIVTDVGGNKEVCADGETGFIVPAPTAGLLAETMERAWARRDEWEAMGKAARERVQKLAPADPIGELCKQLTALAAG